MKKRYLFILSGLLLLMLASCSGLRIEKRQYRDGFYISHNSRNDHSIAASTGQPESTDNNSVESVTTTEGNTEEQKSDDARENDVTGGNESTTVTDIGTVDNSTQSDDGSSSSPGTTQASDQSRSQQVISDEPETPNPHDSDLMLIIEVILAFLIPPLAVFLHEGVTKWFWITFILFLCVFFLFTPYRFGSALWLAGVVIALLVVFDVI